MKSFFAPCLIACATGFSHLHAATNDEPTHDIALLAIQSGLERLAPAIQQAEWTFVVDDCTNVTCAIRFPQAGLTTSITSPQGQIITPQTIANFDIGGPATARKIAPWIIDAERRMGDLQ